MFNNSSIGFRMEIANSFFEKTPSREGGTKQWVSVRD
nr:MAG TPA: hypothetical protein [Caudoviricetes sp.]